MYTHIVEYISQWRPLPPLLPPSFLPNLDNCTSTPPRSWSDTISWHGEYLDVPYYWTHFHLSPLAWSYYSLLLLQLWTPRVQFLSSPCVSLWGSCSFLLRQPDKHNRRPPTFGTQLWHEAFWIKEFLKGRESSGIFCTASIISSSTKSIQLYQKSIGKRWKQYTVGAHQSIGRTTLGFSHSACPLRQVCPPPCALCSKNTDWTCPSWSVKNIIFRVQGHVRRSCNKWIQKLSHIHIVMNSYAYNALTHVWPPFLASAPQSRMATKASTIDRTILGVMVICLQNRCYLELWGQNNGSIWFSNIISIHFPPNMAIHWGEMQTAWVDLPSIKLHQDDICKVIGIAADHIVWPKVPGMKNGKMMKHANTGCWLML